MPAQIAVRVLVDLVGWEPQRTGHVLREVIDGGARGGDVEFLASAHGVGSHLSDRVTNVARSGNR